MLIYNFKPKERAAVIPPSPAPTTIAVSFIFAINDLSDCLLTTLFEHFLSSLLCLRDVNNSE